MVINFGTDGWRAIIADQFTFENVAICTNATLDYLKQNGLNNNGIAIGYDTRFHSDKFAKLVATLASNSNFKTFLFDRPSPTPVLSHYVVSNHLDAGIMITASHNPSDWNGFKIKTNLGSSAPQSMIEKIQERIDTLVETNTKFPTSINLTNNLIKLINPEIQYIEHINSIIDLDIIKSTNLKVIVDSMYGSGQGYFKKLLSGGNIELIELNGTENPAFPNIKQPEPTEENLKTLSEFIKSNNASIGLATDGDADRLGIVDSNGEFISALDLFMLLCFHQLDILGKKGHIIRSITMTSKIDELAKLYGVSTIITPIGFKYLAPKMIESNALIAGEESGGYAYGFHIPERDGILSGLMILDLIVKSQKNVDELINILHNKVTPLIYERKDIHIDPSEKQKFAPDVLKQSTPKSIANLEVINVETLDGIRYQLENNSWGLIRCSGTEPLVRIYAEATTKSKVNSILESLQKICSK